MIRDLRRMLSAFSRIWGLCQEEPAGPMILAPRSSLTQGTRCFRIQWWEILWAVLPRQVRLHYAIMAEKVPWASPSRCESSFYFIGVHLGSLAETLRSVFLTQGLDIHFAVCPAGIMIVASTSILLCSSAESSFNSTRVTGHCGRPRNHNSSAIPKLGPIAECYLEE